MQTPGQIRSHAGLRGVAALLVVAYHFQFGMRPHLWIEDATPFFRRSYLFVDLFFILSGFIISYVNRAERRRGFTGGEYREFLVRRLIRLYPLLAFTLTYLFLYSVLLTIAGALVGRPVPVDWSPERLVELVQQFLMLNAWLPTGLSWNIPSWSISAEMGAYLFFPLAVGLQAWRRSAALVLLLAIPLAYYGVIAATTGSLDIINLGSPLRCIAGFSLGMVGFYARHLFAALPAWALALVQCVCVVVIVAVLGTHSNDVLVIPAFFLLVMSSWTDRGPVARALGSGVMVYLGEISYSVYLNHLCLAAILSTSIWPVLSHLVPPLGDVPSRLLRMGLYYTVVIVGSHLTYHYVEDRSRKLLTRRLVGHRVRPTEASPAAP